MNWPTLYKITFGRTINAEEVADWDALFKRDFPGIRGEEISEAVESIGERNRKAGERGSPATYPQLKSAIIRGRYERSGSAGRGDDAFLSAVRAAMRGAATHAERWDILCDPVGMGVAVQRRTTTDECLILERWAANVWPEWRDGARSVKREMAALMKRVRADVGKEVT